MRIDGPNRRLIRWLESRLAKDGLSATVDVLKYRQTQSMWPDNGNVYTPDKNDEPVEATVTIKTHQGQFKLHLRLDLPREEASDHYEVGVEFTDEDPILGTIDLKEVESLTKFGERVFEAIKKQIE